MFIDGQSWRRGTASRSLKPVPGGGELVLGQSSRTLERHNEFDLKEAFLGEMSFVNIWARVLGAADIRAMVDDCYFMHCGDAIEWSDFRSGTRGEMQIRWPSNIHLSGTSSHIGARTGDAHTDLYIMTYALS